MQSILKTTLLMSAVLFAAFAGAEAAQAGDGGGFDIESYVLDGLDEAEDAADAAASDIADDEDDDEE